MLMVAPTGRTKRVTLLSMPRFSSKHRNVTGRVPALQQTKQEKMCYYYSHKYTEIKLANSLFSLARKAEVGSLFLVSLGKNFIKTFQHIVIQVAWKNIGLLDQFTLLQPFRLVVNPRCKLVLKERTTNEINMSQSKNREVRMQRSCFLRSPMQQLAWFPDFAFLSFKNLR